MHAHDKALHDLICSTMRTSQATDKAKKDPSYLNKLGVALHNIPDQLRTHGYLEVATLKAINELDPSAGRPYWGELCRSFAFTINQSLPEVSE